ncbi:Os12g0466266 [Oryza sativa Japonica Group]|uniref:Os12g0466266 protein n=1 Tax=Oryza sativa subsp. japonica TaxID=39947 RepID=A0A0P0YA08_ORYSJ|nr:Os12g0466266 [Oryza sativa Japonica Group]
MAPPGGCHSSRHTLPKPPHAAAVEGRAPPSPLMPPPAAGPHRLHLPPPPVASRLPSCAAACRLGSAAPIERGE